MNVILESLNSASGSVFVAVLNSLWPAVGVTLASWLALKFTPRISAATRFVVWWAVLAAVLLLPLMQEFGAERQKTPDTPIASSLPMESPNPAVAAPREILSPAADVPAPAPRAPALPVQLRAATWPLWIIAVWFVLFVFHLLRIACSYGYLHGVKERSRPASRELRLNFDEWLLACRVRRPVRLLLSDEIVSPIAVGFFQPAVIVPEPLLQDFTPQELDHVLLHELAHIARRDDWTNLLARLAGAILVLHPVAAWVIRRIAAEREIASDDWVVAMTGSARPYATMLARLFELCRTRRQELLASGMAHSASQLGARIELLLRRGREFAPRACLLRVGLSAIVLLALAVAGAHTPPWIALAQEPSPPSAPDPPAVQPKPQPPEPPAPIAPQATVTPPRAPRPSPSPVAPKAPPQPRVFAEPRTFELTATVEPTVVQPPVVQPAVVLPPNAQPAILQVTTPVQAATPAPEPQAAAQPQPSARGSLLGALVATGYGDLTVDEIIDLKNNGVSADFITGMSHSGWGRLTTKQLINLRVFGISAEYLRKMREAGFKTLEIKDVIDMRLNGVRPEFIQAIHSLGFGPYTAKQAIEFTSQGVHPELFRAFKEFGFTRVEPAEIIEAHVNGIRAEDLREARTYGPNLTLKQIIRLKQAGVI